MPWTIINKEDKIISEYGKVNENDRIISYAQAENEALSQALKIDKNVFVMGQGINDNVGMFGVTTDLFKEYGEKRVFDTPLSEAALTGIAVGSALTGLRPFYCHNRPDFLMLAMDQIVNHASKYSYMSAGQCSVPLVLWAVIGKGWGSAAQHSQALHGLFNHIPGLKIIMPTTPYDAKGLLLSAIADNNPVLVLEHRSLFNQEGHVPEEMYKIPIGKGVVRMQGKDITIVAISEMVNESIKAAKILNEKGIECEIIDLRSIKPYDHNLIKKSVLKTGKLLIVDIGWKTGGVSSDIANNIYYDCFDEIKNKIEVISLPDCPTPASYVLENEFYNTYKDIEKKVLYMLGCE